MPEPTPQPTPLADQPTDNLEIEVFVAGPPTRRSTLRSRKFWCVIAATTIPALNHFVLHMDPTHMYAMMAPWMAWGGGEWGIDTVKSWHESKAGYR